MPKKYILMRHAQSKHNILKKELQKVNQNYKKTEQFRQVKYNKQYHDPKQIIIPEQISIIPIINKQIQLMIVSPLRRCLQTAKYIQNCYKEKGKQIQIIIQPFLVSRICSAWNLGSDLYQLQTEYSTFGYQFINFPQNQHWIINVLNQGLSAASKIENLQQFNRAIDILDHMRKGKLIETPRNFIERVQILKGRLKVHASKCNKNILIISHSCLLNRLCSSLQQKEKAKIKFRHLDFVEVNQEFKLNRDKEKELRKHYEEKKNHMIYPSL